MKNVVLSNEDFQDFPIGEFPYDKDHTAMGEYQYVVENGYHGNWVDMVCNYTYNGTGPTWLITERDGRHFIESMRIEKIDLTECSRLWKLENTSGRIMRCQLLSNVSRRRVWQDWCLA